MLADSYVDASFEPGTYLVTYSCPDEDNNVAIATRLITVTSSDLTDISSTDTIPPVITLYGPASVPLRTGSSYADPGAACHDNWGGDITGQLMTSSDPDTGSTGTYTITYTCTDEAGNHAAPATRTITVEADPSPDTTSPVITLTYTGITYLVVGDTYTEPGAACTDDTDGDLPVEVLRSGVDTAAPGNYKIIYGCVDAAGNWGYDVRNVTVLPADEDAPPVIVVPPPTTIPLGSTYVDPGATCTDREDDVRPVTVITYQLDTSVLGEQQIYYTCEDSAGNHTTEGRTVTVVEP